MIHSRQNTYTRSLFKTACVFLTILIFNIFSIAATSAETYSGDNSLAESDNITTAHKAIMIIRFNQKNVYFQEPLKKVVYRVSNVKPNAKYEIESVIPNGKETYSLNGRTYSDNLSSVIKTLNNFGVSINRISTKTIVSDSIRTQEINLFVK